MTTPPPMPADAERKLSASIDYWKRSLLDLTHRNRALNFKPARVSTIVIVDEQPAEVFRQLCLDRGSMKFKPAPEPEPEPVGAPAPAGSLPAGSPAVSQPGAAATNAVAASPAAATQTAPSDPPAPAAPATTAPENPATVLA